MILTRPFINGRVIGGEAIPARSLAVEGGKGGRSEAVKAEESSPDGTDNAATLRRHTLGTVGCPDVRCMILERAATRHAEMAGIYGSRGAS